MTFSYILAIEGKYTLEVVDGGCEKHFIIDFLHILFLWIFNSIDKNCGT